MDDLETKSEFRRSDYVAVLLLPSVGCSGCISSTEQFVRDTEDAGLFLVITKSISKKDAINTLRVLDTNTSFYYDSDNLFYNNEDPKAIYPLIVYLNEKRVIFSEYVEPLNPDALNNLYEFLKG